MLQQVFMKGPFTQGIFRKSANARLVRELRERLDSTQELALEHIPVLAVAALLKEFLRSLPDPLLGAALYPLYMEALECRDEQEKLIRVKRYVSYIKTPMFWLPYVCDLYPSFYFILYQSLSKSSVILQILSLKLVA
jgi:hypothetical protein